MPGGRHVAGQSRGKGRLAFRIRPGCFFGRARSKGCGRRLRACMDAPSCGRALCDVAQGRAAFCHAGGGADRAQARDASDSLIHIDE